VALPPSWYVPAAHWVHSAAPPGAALKRPTPQGSHVEGKAEAAAAKKPAGQAAHAAAPERPLVVLPGAQGSQLLAPGAAPEKRPGVQLLQLASPVALPYDPSGHSAHAAAPSTPLVLLPTGQGTQRLAPLALEKVPLLQALHALAKLACAVCDARPAGQRVQAPLACLSAYVPAAQGAQRVLAAPLKKPGGQASQAGRSRMSE